MRIPLTAVDRTFLLTSIVVAASTAALPNVRGYGTVTFQMVVFTAWMLLERATSGDYAAQHDGVRWIITTVVNVVAFWALAVPVWIVLRTRSRFVAATALVAVCAFYLAALFWLVPATDGP